MSVVKGLKTDLMGLFTVILEHLSFQALVDIVNKIHQALPPGKTGKRMYGPGGLGTGSRVKGESTLTASDGGATRQQDEKPFDGMNNIVANLMLNMTR